MTDKTMNLLMEHGYKAVPTSDIKDVLKEGSVKRIHIEVTTVESSALLARVKANNVIVKYDKMDDELSEYLTIAQSDELNTHLFSVPINSIKDIAVRISNGIIDIFFNLSDNSYQMILENISI